MSTQPNKNSASASAEFWNVVYCILHTAGLINIRPPLLAYGLHMALEELTDGYLERNPATDVEMDVVDADQRYPLKVEEHVFRIMQQALENALTHAGGRRFVSVAVSLQDTSRCKSVMPAKALTLVKWTFVGCSWTGALVSSVCRNAPRSLALICKSTQPPQCRDLRNPGLAC
ncbi:hypothetical protein GC175_29650 [bacterium]|nr:hypothetical protein [bacterium]